MSYIQSMNGFEFVPFHYPFTDRKALLIRDDQKSIESYRAFIQKNNIDQAEIVTKDLRILQHFPMLKHLRIFASTEAQPPLDFSPLYDMPEVVSLFCRSTYGDRQQFTSEVDYSRIQGLVELAIHVNKGARNFSQIQTLKSLLIGGFSGANRDLTDMFQSELLDTMRIAQCGVHSLNGLSRAKELQCLYLEYNRSLHDIRELASVKKTLKALRIEKCPKIEDFSVLRELENLEYLALEGTNSIPSLDFLRALPNLKTFIFDVVVEDGDLSPCLDLEYVYCAKGKKHYNLRDKDLPKLRYTRGNECIEQWRRLE